MTDPRVIDTTKHEPIVITHPSGSTTTITPDGEIQYSASQVGEIASVATGDPIETVPIDLTKIPTIEVPNDFVGVAPMAAPTGLIFALRPPLTNGDTMTTVADTINANVLTPDKISDTAVAADLLKVASQVAAQEAAKPLKFTVKFNYPHTWVESNPEKFSGVAYWESFPISIQKDGKDYLRDLGNIMRLNDMNSIPANRFIAGYLELRDDSLIVEHDVKVADFPTPDKVQFILDKLNG